MIAWTALTSKISIVIRKTSTGLKILESDWKIWKICRKKLVAMCKAWIYMYRNISTWYILPTCIRCEKISLTQFFTNEDFLHVQLIRTSPILKLAAFDFVQPEIFFFNFWKVFQANKIDFIRIWIWKNKILSTTNKKLRDEVCTDIRWELIAETGLRWTKHVVYIA